MIVQGSSSFNHFALFKSKARTRKVADDAMVSIAGSQDLQDQFGLNKDQAGFGLNAFSITGTLIADKCPGGKECRDDNGGCDCPQVEPVMRTSPGEPLTDPAIILIILYGEVK